MARLALAIEEDARQIGPGRVRFRLTASAGELAHKAFGESILVYRPAPGALMFIGAGRVVGLEFELPGFEVVQLDEFLWFDPAVPGAPEIGSLHPGVTQALTLQDFRFDELLREAGATGAMPGMQEAHSIFTHDPEPGFEVYEKLHDRVLQHWHYRCALTGEQFKPSPTRPHPQLRVVSIRPRERGGLLHVRNYLPMIEAAEHAWVSGHITLGAELGFVVAERLIDPELHDRLLPLGRLQAPDDFGPDPVAVAYHRANVFDRD